MCGLLGRVSTARLDRDRWANAIGWQSHRGPDGQGEWHAIIGNWEVSLAHQRLAIIDLTSCGAQPMHQPSTGSVLVYNGEIYNYLEVRAELESLGVTFQSASDTEVLLHALEMWGPDDALARLNGMWAFAWLDRRSGTIVLSRDRCGEKPLYVSAQDDTLLFASELKSLLCLIGQRRQLNRGPLLDFLALGLVNTTCETMFCGIEQVEPGTSVSFPLGGSQLGPKAPRHYWRLGVAGGPACGNCDDFVEVVRSSLEQSVRVRLRSDVPVGVLLSGGVDSSAIAAAANRCGAKVALYSLANTDPQIDESPYARAVAERLGLQVNWLTMPPEREALMSDLEAATWMADAPLAGFSYVALYRIMRMARDAGVTVILSGQGGDELFCGYRKYLGFHLMDLARRGRWVKLVRQATPWLMNGTLIPQWSAAEAGRYLPAAFRRGALDLIGEAFSGAAPSAIGLLRGQTIQERQAADLARFSVPTLVHYEDRMSMAWSREVRLPFLDHHLIDAAVPAPIEWKLHAGWSKYALRKAIEPWLPREVVWRRVKQGFTTPEAGWMRGELQAAIAEHLSPSAEVFQRGLVSRDALLALNTQMCTPGRAGSRVWVRDVFRVLALELWLRRLADFVS